MKTSELIPTVKAIKRIAQGAVVYTKTKQTPEYAYLGLRDLYWRSGGRSNDIIHKVVRARHRRYPLPGASGILGNLGVSEVDDIVQNIRRNGYHVFDTKLDSSICAELSAFALTQEAVQVVPSVVGNCPLRYSPDKPEAQVYRFSQPALIQDRTVQSLLGDMSLLCVAQAYLGSRPTLDLFTMWWSTCFRQEALDQAAQLYHFDMDRVKFLKFFVYLTDVTTNTGPHCYIRGSHVPSSRLALALKGGDRRMQDQEMQAHFEKIDFVELTGGVGTILAVDTRGYHKGKPLVTGDRLLFQVEYADSLFGALYENVIVPSDADHKLVDAMRRYPSAFVRFQSEN